jgi:glyoxylase-like metal-dependent hydrolase (beta-lactamase superfamily II)
MSLPARELFALFFQQPAWKINMLNDETGLFTGRGGTILFSKTKEGYVVVDSQFPEQSKILIDELRKKGESPFRLLINTHHHGDHSGGNISFKGIVQHVLAHQNSKLNQEKVAIDRKTEANQLYPDQTFTDTWSEKIGKEKFTLHYFGAGHTNGDSLVHLEQANMVHMGDLLFRNIYPNIDRGAGASIKNWITVLGKAEKTFSKKTKFICGHSPKPEEVVVGADFLPQMQFYLQNLLSFVEKEIKAGKTKEEILQNTFIPGADNWKDAFKFVKVNLTVAYEELTAS